MLVSVAVLTLILVFTSQLMNSTAISTGMSGRHVDSDSQARAVFDRMSRDFAAMPQRKDLDFLFAKQNGGGAVGASDKMFFYSEAPAYYPTTNPLLFPAASTGTDPKSSLALIGYYVNPGINNTGAPVAPPAYCLQRLARGLTWDAQVPSNSPGGISFLTFQPGLATDTPYPATTISGAFGGIGSGPTYSGTGDPDYDVLSSEVFRMEFCFQVKDLRVPGQAGKAYSNYPVAYCAAPNSRTLAINQPADPPTTGANVVGDRWYNALDNRAYLCTSSSSASGNSGPETWAPIGMSDVSAIVVAIAILDTNTRKILTPSQIAAAAAGLVDFPEPPPSATAASVTPTFMATTWQSALDASSPSFAAQTGIPATAAGQVRVYQRYFYLNNF
jgi:hypothetical protein